MPGEFDVISPQAFEGDASIDSVTLLDDITRMQSRAFAGSSVGMIYLPDTLEYIAP